MTEQQFDSLLISESESPYGVLACSGGWEVRRSTDGAIVAVARRFDGALWPIRASGLMPATR